MDTARAWREKKKKEEEDRDALNASASAESDSYRVFGEKERRTSICLGWNKKEEGH